MSSGKTHDKLIEVTALAIPVVAYIATDLPSMVCLGLSAGIWANIWISPDLDLHNSRPLKHWQKVGLGWVWAPYRRIFSHRGSFFRRNFWTHCPVIGTFIRSWLLIALIVAAPISFSLKYGLIVGLVLGDTVHLIGDICQSYFDILK